MEDIEESESEESLKEEGSRWGRLLVEDRVDWVDGILRFKSGRLFFFIRRDLFLCVAVFPSVIVFAVVKVYWLTDPSGRAGGCSKASRDVIHCLYESCSLIYHILAVCQPSLSTPVGRDCKSYCFASSSEIRLGAGVVEIWFQYESRMHLNWRIDWLVGSKYSFVN
jgi:hypothetical protein